MCSEHTRRTFFKSAAAASLAYAIGGRRISAQTAPGQRPEADVILMNGRLTTQDERRSFASPVAVKDGRFLAVGSDRDVLAYRGDRTQTIDVGGWTEFQFATRRLPTLDEINAAAPDTPVFVLHLYDRALLNGAALRAVGYTKDTPNPPGGEIQRDGRGNPTGLLLAKPNASILYATLAKGPKLSPADQRNSTRQFMRELNRFGITSVIDASGGFQNYPEDQKGAIVPGQLVDLAVLSADYFSVPDEQIKGLESVLTIVGGKVVYGADAFERLAPAPLPVSPSWSPVAEYGGYSRAAAQGPAHRRSRSARRAADEHARAWVQGRSGLWSLGCECFAF